MLELVPIKSHRVVRGINLKITVYPWVLKVSYMLLREDAVVAFDSAIMQSTPELDQIYTFIS